MITMYGEKITANQFAKKLVLDSHNPIRKTSNDYGVSNMTTMTHEEHVKLTIQKLQVMRDTVVVMLDDDYYTNSDILLVLDSYIALEQEKLSRDATH